MPDGLGAPPWLEESHRDRSALQAVLRRLLRGAKERQGHEEEERLRWLGIISEEGAGHWRWAAPILEDWARRWLD